MKINFNRFSDDGLKLYGTAWLPENDPLYLLLCVHGLGEHSGRFENLAFYLNENGIAVYSIDLRGHGFSEGKRGFNAGVNSWMNDLETLMKYARAEFNDLPMIFYGQKLGGTLVAKYLADQNIHEIQAMILYYPWFITSINDLTAENNKKMQSMRIYQKLFSTFKLTYQDIAISSVEAETLKNDPLIQTVFHRSIRKMIAISGADAVQNAGKLRLPKLLIDPEEVSVNFEASLKYAKRSGADFNLFPAMKNSLINYQGIADWIRKNTYPLQFH